MAAYTSTDLVNIKAAIASGVMTATIAGEMVQYRSLPEMLKIKRLIEADLAAASGTAITAFPVRYPSTDRGV